MHYVYITADEMNNFPVKLSEKPGINESIMYYEKYDSVNEAAERKSAIETWSSRKKELVIKLVNPGMINCANEIIN